MTSKLALYNAALREIGSDRIAALTTQAERRYVLDDVYDGVIEQCLEAGQWKFAIRSAEIPASTTVTPAFGYAYAFSKPSDLIRLTAISASEQLEPSLENYRDETGYWYADVDTLYTAYVSSDPTYGLDLSFWTPSFIRFVELSLAERICLRLTQSDTKHDIVKKDLKVARKNARSLTAQAGPNKAPDSEGSWLEARFGSNRIARRRYDRA